MRIKFWQSTVAVILLAGGFLFSLDPARAITQYNLRAWNTDNGLPQATIHAVLQASDGFLWIGTQEGLVRFDGINFIVHEEAFTPGLAGNFINALCEDSEGALWIGTHKGLSRYRNQSFQSFGVQSGLPDKYIKALAAAEDGSVWIGTPAGLSHLSNGEFHNFTREEGLSDLMIERLFIDSAKRIWVGTRHGLCWSQSIANPRFVVHSDFAEQAVMGICEDAGGHIWVATDLGLFRGTGAEARRFSRVPDFEHSDMQTLYTDLQGSLWIGTRTSGLHRYSQGGFSSFGTVQGLPDDWINSLAEDCGGDLWVGTSTGLIQLQDGRFICIGTPEGLSHDIVFSLHEGKDGSIWIGTQRGLNHLRDGVIRRYYSADGLSNDSINAVCETASGEIWVGTDAGLNCLRGGRPVPFRGRDIFAKLMIYSLLQDPSGALWISTTRGAFRMENGRILQYDSRNKLPGDQVNFIVVDRLGNTWFSVYGKGLACLHRNGEMEHYSERNGLASNMVNAVLEETDGTLWFGTMNGLSRFKGGRFASLTKKQGLFNDSIFVILEDGKGNFWMSCNKGIFRMAKSDLHSVADGRSLAAAASVFGRKDGMRSAECNSSGLHVGMRDKLGRLWFATMRGAEMIDPMHLRVNKMSPTVILEQFSVNNRRIAIPVAGATEPVVLAAGSRDFLFRFSAPSLAYPEAITLRSFLEGYDLNWQTAGAERLSRYTDLPPGEYKFRVIAGNSDGVWNFKGVSLRFRVKRFFYQTPLFFVFCILALALSTTGIIYLRTRHLRKKERYLQQKIAEHTEQLARINEELQLTNKSLAEQISEREKFERRLEQANLQLQDSNIKLKELDRLKTDFISITSHELRTPLTSVLGFAHLIRRRLSDLFDEKRTMDEKKRRFNVEKIKESIEIIVTEGKRLTTLINDLLDIAKMEAGKMEWKCGSVEVEEIVRQALASTAALFETKRISISSHCDDDLPQITGDRDRLIQVLINLLSNAVKFTDRGSVTITAKRMNESIQIKVCDTGCGIAPEDLPFIFQKFKQLGDRNAGSQGSGLGLVISKEIVEHHGGAIQVRSDPGAGSEFTVILPSSHADTESL